MSSSESPFLKIPENDWICSNALAFAISDGFPVSPGHVLITTRRVVETWFDATDEEQAAMMALVKEVARLLDEKGDPKPDGYNVGFNAGLAAGQTVPHVHIHVIPRYHGDMPDPRGGVRHVIPGKGNYLAVSDAPDDDRSATATLSLSTGHPHDPLWNRIGPRLSGANEVDLLASFIQPSGLDLIQTALFAALRTGATVRVLVGDYLFITSPEALRRLLGWMELVAEEAANASFEVRLVETAKLRDRPESFHPKAWRIADSSGGLIVVGSSNLSRAALQSGIEWNLIEHSSGRNQLSEDLSIAFEDLWLQATPLDAEVVTRYAVSAAESRRQFIEAESIDSPVEIKSPRPWQIAALEALARIRQDAYRRALVAVATGLGKTWLAAFDVVAAGKVLNRLPKVLIIAHRAEILVQAEATIRPALQSEWENLSVTWYRGASSDLTGDLVVASIQKLTRPEGLAALDNAAFDYVVIDEVHHAEAPSYRRVLARLRATFTLGLTATPERADGVDVASLFDDVLAWQATIGDGITEGSLVPFHYLGLKDDVDFQQIPWRNGRFDPQVLEEKLENSARMERLWSAWQEDPQSRTLVFCCSRRHALFTRDWLRRRNVRTAAVFSGTGGDPRSDSLANFVAGKLEALCVVDLFNEGLDVPDVDRVVMLRPTESKVIFLQQLGRGLRAAEHKSRLKVIDFVGNHRIFASRLIHLLSLGGDIGSWSRLKQFLKDGKTGLPEGCLIDLQVEAKQVLMKLLPSGGSAAVEAYKAMRDDLQRRPTPSELYHHGYLPSTIRANYGSWFEFAAAQSDLSEEEHSVLTEFREWLKMLELTNLFRSYKMVVLRVLLDRDAMWTGVNVDELSAACREYLLAHPVLRFDLPPTKQFPDPATTPMKDWSAWWQEWPLARWLDDQSGRRWFKQTEEQFVANFACAESLRPFFEAMTGELVDYRLAHYIGTRLTRIEAQPGTSVVAKVSHSNGKPILFVPGIEIEPGRPTGPTAVQLPDGTVWTFRFVKVACNVAAPQGGEGNQLPELLRSWFGEDAGAPGTGFQMRFTKSATGWTAEPMKGAPPLSMNAMSIPAAQPEKRELALVASPPKAKRFTQFVPVHSLQAAAGLWGPQAAPEEMGWTKIPGVAIQPGMFVAKVRGRSMEPRIPDDSWCLFRKCPAGSREGRIVLVQFNSLGDLENGGRFTVKRYHSEKTVTEDAWSHQRIQLLPLNPAYKPIEVDPAEATEMIVVGEFVRVV